MDQENKKIKKPEEKTETKSLLEDWPSFCAWEQALDDSRSKGIPAFLQEPEDKQISKEGVKPLSELNAQQGASTQQAQDLIKNASEESGPKQLTYEDLTNQLQNLEKQIKQIPSASYDELVALKKKIADLNKEIVKRTPMRDLGKKISELSKQLQQPEDEEDSESKETEASEAKSAEG
ncbi:MAG: hypothetical protein ABR909_12945 [Candidatus Bathyarchaeia archaeon]|jgi:polyhydroxyalkanoate synthesis regulator phasin